MPNRASQRSSTTAARASRPREKIVLTAVALADREGLPAVSIRRVAADLEMRPMSLYTYVASKEELLDLMTESVVEEALVSNPPQDDWRAAVEMIATRAHEVFIAHPWLPSISQGRLTLGANALRHAEQLLEAIAPLNLGAAEAWRVLFLINDYTLGHALRIAHAPPQGAGAYPPFQPEQFPRLAQALKDSPRRDQDTFLDGLHRILSGIGRHHKPTRGPNHPGAAA